jgi:glycosyltransferase involved in cell wall biosynthesis
VQRWREQYRLGDDLLLPGFKQHAELPNYYGLAKAFILASTSETWGLVVNEALASSLPVLISDHCGCVEDLLVHGRNGFRFNPYDVENLSRLMQRLASPETDLVAMGRVSGEIVAKWSPDAWADSLQLASRAAHACPQRGFGLVERLVLRLLIHR